MASIVMRVPGFWFLVCVVCATGEHERDIIDFSDILIVALTQPDEYNVKKALEFEAHVRGQATHIDERLQPAVELTHHNWQVPGAWTFIPLIAKIVNEYPNKQWVLLCLDGTRINLFLLRELLDKYAKAKPLFIGRGLRDQEATIIHHFAFHENPGSFAYPDVAAGTVISRELLQRLHQRLLTSKPPSDFSIDAMHELAMLIRDDGKGHLLTEDPAFCAADEREGCVTTYRELFPNCGQPIDDDDIFFAVKTCTKFHGERVPVVQKTWGRDARHLVFYSDTADPTIPTQATGVPNTERGHCGKMMAILRQFHTQPSLRAFRWLVIADDDTLLSVPRLRSLLACYKPTTPILLGERYGYSVSNNYGYNYITGGGGMVLSRAAIDLLMESETCMCGSDEAPDDMTLGMCFKRLAVPVTHSPLFHQARPSDYSKRLLEHQRPVSFHKHWMIDPVKVYQQWFGTEDNTDHDEL